jgi:glutathione synthase/RimK-type ligase-like ATP-grasp enzyme
MNNTFRQIIKEICNEEGIKYDFISKDFVTILKKDHKINYLFGYKIGLNDHALGNICDDKYATHDLLKYLNIPIIEYKIVYNKDNNNDYAKDCNTYEYVHNYFKNNNRNIVIKQNLGTCGIGVYHITKEIEIDEVLDKLFRKNFSISMCPYYEILNEYRFVIVNDEVMLKYAKYKPEVIGNGKDSIRKLLFDFNYSYFKNNLKNKEYDRILNEDEVFTYNWKYNLSGGAISKKIDDKKLDSKLTKLALKTAKKINLKIGSIDIIKTKDNKLFILEINSGIMLDNYIRMNKDGYNIAKDIYKKAIISLFK